MKSNPALPADVQQALEKGQLIEAIKLLRTRTGLGLAEAKHAIESHANGVPTPIPSMKPALAFGDPDMPAAAADALRQGHKIEAIRIYREQRGTGLKEAKDAVDAFEARMTPASQAGLSPGEVPPSGFGKWAAITVGALLLLLVGMLARRML